MKVLKDNLWNKFFYKKKLQKRKELKRLKDIERTADEYMPRLNECNSLMGLMHLHKELWAQGLRNKNIGPCQDGIFRTQDIITMKPDEVFLGNVFGLWTFAIPEWEKIREVADSIAYNIVCEQYRQLLMSNVVGMKNEAKEKMAHL